MRIAPPLFALALAACSTTPSEEGPPVLPRPAEVGPPRSYVCPRTKTPPVIDGVLERGEWAPAPPTADFVDIRGASCPAPKLRTRAMMMWDDECLYVAGVLEEPHVWATLTERDSIIFHDNDFEVFIDPDGDTHGYYELETNAFGTDWDLFLVKPYRDGGPALHGWDIAGLRTEVAVQGTSNDPSDVDEGWTVEIAIPWPALAEAANRPAPPAVGDAWRVGLSRVEWHTHVEDGMYVKDVDPATGVPLPEENWVWSPQGLVNMHYPETWGYVFFAEEALARPDLSLPPPGTWPPDDLAARQRLREVYFTLRSGYAQRGTYRGIQISGGTPIPDWLPPVVEVGDCFFHASMRHHDGRVLSIREDGRIWTTAPGGRE